MATNIYGTYDPYSADNLQGYSGLMSSQETSTEPTSTDYISYDGGDGGATFSGGGQVSQSPYGDQYAQARAMGVLGSLAGNTAKSAVSAGLQTGNPLDGLAGLVTGTPSAVQKAMVGSSGFAPTSSTGKLASKATKMGLGLLGGPVGLMASFGVDPAVSGIMDLADARDYESIRDEVEDSELGEVGGRRGFADMMDALNSQSAFTGTAPMDYMDMDTVAEALSQYSNQAEMASQFNQIDSLQKNLNAVEALEIMNNYLNQQGNSGGNTGYSGGLSADTGSSYSNTMSANIGNFGNSGNSGGSSSGGTSSDNNSAGDQSSNDGIGGR